MKVTIVQIHLCGSTGTDYYHVQAFGLARRLSELGCEVTILTADRNPEQHNNGRLREKHQDGYKIVYIPVRSEVYHQTFVNGLEEALEQSKPDVVQVAELVELTTLKTVRWCRKRGIPSVIWHGAYAFFGKGVLAQKVYLNTAGRYLCRSASALIAKTTSAKSFLEHLGARPEKVHAIPVGLDTEAFLCRHKEPVNLSWIPSQPFIMNVGQMVPRKNQAHLVQALRQVCDIHPEFNLLIIGSGVEAQNLRSLAKSFGLAENVTLQTERVPNSVLAQVYDKAFITAMPSEYEIFGMTILESFACGTPVIGRCGGGMSDLIEDGITGYLYEDVDDISRRIIRLYEDREVYLSLRKTAQEASAKYDWKAVAPRFLAVYSSCLSAGKRGQV